MGEPLAKLWLFASVGATNEIKKEISVGEPLAKFRLLSSIRATEEI